MTAVVVDKCSKIYKIKWIKYIRFLDLDDCYFR